jgi:alpha-mannosidase
LGPGTDWIAELLDVRTGRSFVRPGCGGVVVLDDPSDTWSHGIDAFREEVGQFEVVGRPEVVEWGPLRWTLRVLGEWGQSWIIQEISVSKGQGQVDVRAEIGWHERHRMAKLRMPTRVRSGEATFDIAYGVITRPQTGEEEPGQRWVDVSGDLDGATCGVALLNDSKYGFDVLDGEVRMSVVRSPIYAFHDPAQVQPGERYEYTDQGRHTFRYAIVPHAGDWRDAGIARAAAEFNRPCLVLHEPGHAVGLGALMGGRALPLEYSLAATDSAHVDIETIKPAESGRGMALRLRETHGEPTECRLTLAGEHCVPLSFRAWEIKTVIAARDGGTWRTWETDLLERQ